LSLAEIKSFQTIEAGESQEFWDTWNGFVRRFGTTPFYFGGFVETYMDASRRLGWTPQIIVVKTQGKLAGVAALQTRGVLGNRTAASIFPRNYGTDFAIDPRERELFIRSTLRFLFEKLRCQYLDLIMPTESPNLELMRQFSSCMGLEFTIAPLGKEYAEHSVIEVTGTWDEFKSSRGRKFVQRYREIERLLSRSGSWATERTLLDRPEAVRMVETIEGNSWKDAWRRERGIESDPNLPAFFAYWKLKSTVGGYLPELYILKLSGQPIAYTIVMKLNGVAFLCKTSFDRRYGRASPGEYIQNVAVQDLFESQEVVRIDFLTALDYLNRWTALHYIRERTMISRTVPLLSGVVKTLKKSSLVRNAYNAYYHPGMVSRGSPPPQAVRGQASREYHVSKSKHL